MQLQSSFYKNNFIRTSKLKIAKIKNKLRTVPASELIAQGKILKNDELHHVFSMFIKNNLRAKFRT